MSVTGKEMERKFASLEIQERDCSYSVNVDEMARFKDQDKQLSQKIRSIKLKFDVEYCGGKSSKGYEDLSDLCQIPVDTIKKTIRNDRPEAKSKIKPTRNFVYKLAVGLKMSIKEANELFALCGGSLTEETAADYICIKALEHGDDIYHFLEEYKKYIGKEIGMNDN